MGTEGEILVYLEYLRHHHLPRVESKNQRLRSLLRDSESCEMKTKQTSTSVKRLPEH